MKETIVFDSIYVLIYAYFLKCVFTKIIFYDYKVSFRNIDSKSECEFSVLYSLT